MRSYLSRFAFLLACWLVTAVGCTDGPFFHMKKLNPYIQSQWRKDREKAVVYSQRVDEMRRLKSQIASMPPEEQTKWIGVLDGILKSEPSPELRREAVLALLPVAQRPDAIKTLVPTSRDKNEKVRMAVVQAIGPHPTPESTPALLAMAQGDPSSSVKLSATHALGKHPGADVRQFLAERLEDRSPAMQYQASLALKEQTGKDFGGDVESWQRYLRGEDVPEPKASLAETLKSVVPLWR